MSVVEPTFTALAPDTLTAVTVGVGDGSVEEREHPARIVLPIATRERIRVACSVISASIGNA
jgi:hypothetical protein